jgi:hypothetical protein
LDVKVSEDAKSGDVESVSGFRNASSPLGEQEGLDYLIPQFNLPLSTNHHRKSTSSIRMILGHAVTRIRRKTEISVEFNFTDGKRLGRPMLCP